MYILSVEVVLWFIALEHLVHRQMDAHLTRFDQSVLCHCCGAVYLLRDRCRSDPALSCRISLDRKQLLKREGTVGP